MMKFYPLQFQNLAYKSLTILTNEGMRPDHRMASNVAYYTGRKSFKSGVKSERKSRGYLLLVIPVTTFCLGCWQWRRHHWKTNLLAKIRENMDQPPVEFPVDNLTELNKMEYRRVHIRGQYLYQRQFLIRWRARMDERWLVMASTLQEDAQRAGKYGAQIITPLLVDGTDGLIVMVNRGWLPTEAAETEIAMGRQREPQRVELNAVVRKSEKPNRFVQNQPEKGIWAYKDLRQMGQFCGAAPILLDADAESTQPGGPIGGQTNATLRNEHFNYMLQWFGLSGGTLALWLMKFMK